MRRSTRSIVRAAATALLAASAAAASAPSAAASSAKIGVNNQSDNPSRKQAKNGSDACRSGYVALTFDDGPTVSTPALLAALAKAGLRATFFDLGVQGQRYPSFVADEVAAGHAVGNHSYDHPDLTSLNAADISTELSATQEVLAGITGQVPTLFRPPYGSIDETVRSVADDLSLTPVIWTVDTVDWSRPPTSAIVASVLAVRTGGIVLMHDGYSNTIAAIPKIAEGLKQRQLCAGQIVPSVVETVAWEGLTFPAAVRSW